MAVTAQRRHPRVEQKEGWEGKDPVRVERNQLDARGLTCWFFHSWSGGRAAAGSIDIRVCKSLTTSLWQLIAAHTSEVRPSPPGRLGLTSSRPSNGSTTASYPLLAARPSGV